MAIVMKQQNRAEEAIEAIKSLRHRCSDQAQESLDNILLDLYKVCSSSSHYILFTLFCKQMSLNEIIANRDVGDWMIM